MPKELEPYEVLKIHTGATPLEIRRAYYNLAKLYHPDRHSSVDVQKLFQTIVRAYEILTNKYPADSAVQVVIMEDRTTDDNRIQTLVTKDSIIQKQHSRGVFEDKIIKIILAAEIKYSDIKNTIEENAFLWMATKPNHAPIYIFTSLHATSIDLDERFGEILDQLIDKVDMVRTEININPSLSQIFETATPGASMDPRNGLDYFIACKAKLRGKPIKWLETEEVRLIASRFDKYSTYEKTKGLKAYSIDDINKISDNYLTHVFPSEFKLENIDMHARRNFCWLPRMIKDAKNETPVLHVCGAMHSSGRFGLPNLLAEEGFTLTPILKTVPQLRNDRIRGLFFKHSNFNSQKKATDQDAHKEPKP